MFFKFLKPFKVCRSFEKVTNHKSRAPHSVKKSVALSCHTQMDECSIKKLDHGFLTFLTPWPKKLETQVLWLKMSNLHFYFTPNFINLFLSTKTSLRTYDFNTFSYHLCVAHQLRISTLGFYFASKFNNS